MARKYDLHTTKDFLVWAIILAALGLWCVKDGWFPAESVMDRHPRLVTLKADVDGMITDVYLTQGVSVIEGQPAVRLLPYGTNAPVVLKTLVKGEVIKVQAKKTEDVKIGAELITIQPQDSFYAFNKSLAFLGLLGATICIIIHKAIR